MIDWIESVFTAPPNKAMQGLDWGDLYERFHGDSYKTALIDADLRDLLDDPAVRDRKGIYEYLLDGKQNPQLLNVRLFDATIKQQAFKEQTTAAKAAGWSNCPLCTHGSNANKDRIYEMKEMEADHVTAWSKGGQSTLSNCEMLCVPHNRSKGNR